MSSPKLVRQGWRACCGAIALTLCFALSVFPQTPSQQISAAQFAQELSSAASLEAGNTLLTERPQLITAELFRALMAQAERLLTERKLAASAISFELAEKIAEQLKDESATAAALHGQGLAAVDQGKVKQALDAFARAITLREKLNQPSELATSLTRLANLNRRIGNLEEARTLLQRAWTLFEQTGVTPDSLDSLYGLGQIAVDLADFADANQYYEQCLRYCDSMPQDQVCRPRTLFGLGQLAYKRGDLEKSSALYHQCLELSEATKNDTGIAYALNALGLIAKQQGDLRHALDYFQRSLVLKEKKKDVPGQITSLLNIGQVYFQQSNEQLSRTYTERSLQLAESIQQIGDIIAARNNLAMLHRDAKRYAEAQAQFESNLALARKLRDASLTAVSLANLGRLQLTQDRPIEAIELYEQALKIEEQRGETKGRLLALNGLSEAQFVAHQYEAALANAERATKLAQKLDVSYDWAHARATAGKSYLELKQLPAAQQAFTDAISTIEKLRSQVAGDEQERQRFLASVVEIYHDLARVQVAAQRPAEALAVIESAKARTLLDVLRNGRAALNKSLTIAERDEERRLAEEVVRCNTQLARLKARSTADATRLNALQQQLEQARLAQEEFQLRLFAVHPELAVLRAAPPPFTLAQAATLLPDKRSALLEYAVTQHSTYLFVLTRGTSTAAEPQVQVYELPVTRAQLQTRVTAYRDMLAARNLLFRDAASELYDLLIKPALKQLQGCTQLVIVPDASLWELPFQTLQSPAQRYLIEDFALTSTPSLSVLVEIKRSHKTAAPAQSNNSLLALGNPAFAVAPENASTTAAMRGELLPLPHAEAEIKAIAKLYGAQHSRTYLGDEAREDRFKSEAANYRILHLASHSLLNDIQPMYSQIVLTQNNNPSGEDGLLEAWELAQLNLHADLVILSACETARGKVRPGEGMIGLSWALFVAGAPAAVVSQWQVDSASTTDLMVAFHRRLTQNPAASKAAALRGAALEMLRGKYRHPFYWAGFVLVGNGF